MRQGTTGKEQDVVLDGVQDIGQYSPGHNQDATRHGSGTRATVHEAANALGVSVDAIRKRIQRGTIPHERHEDGRVYVLLDKASTMQDTSSISSNTMSDEEEDDRPVRYGTDEFVESLQDQIGFLRRELERKDAILLRMAERIPELAASQDPQEPRGGPEPSSGSAERGEAPPRTQEPKERRSWLHRFFGLE